MKARRPLSRGLIFGVLVLYALWVVLPMLWVAYSSFKDDAAIFRQPFSLPTAETLRTENYAHAWREAQFGTYFFNSIVVTTVSVTLIVLLGAMAAYALARFYHPAGNFVF